MRPRILVTPWRRVLPTYLGERTVLDALDPAYADRVVDAGGLPLVLPRPPGGAAVEVAREALALAHGLLLTGGGDIAPATYEDADDGASQEVDPEADRWELALLRAAARERLPTLGVCRGAQIMAVAFGGRLWTSLPAHARHRDPSGMTPEEMLAERHRVEVAPGSALAGLVEGEAVTVNTLHHQSIADPGALAVTATAAGGLPEALEPAGELAGWPALGVQWHPEKMPDPLQRRLFERLVAAARERAAAPA